MQIWVHDTRMRKVTAINNAIPRMLSFYNSTWHRYLPQATNTFDFTIPKLYSGKLHEDLSFINDRAYFSFRNQGKNYVFYVANMVEDDFSIQLTCNDTNLELNNEQANAFSSDSAQTLAWYLEHMDLLAFTSLKIGINEISDRKRTLTFDSQETKLARLQSLMSQFDAEYEFVTELNNNGTLKQITLNIYQSPDSTHHGVGKVRSDVLLYYGNDVKGVQVTTDKTQLFNMAVFTGQDGLSMKDVERSDKNEDGKEEFYTRKGNEAVYAPLSAEMYPSTLRDGDNWTRKDFQTEYTDVNDLTAYAFRTMKQYAYPIITYTASVQSSFLGNYSDLALGDTVKIYDGNFVGGLALEARVTEQIISFDNPNNNSLVFSNYVKLKNTVSATLQKRLAELVEANTPYTIKLARNNSLIFKNGQGETIITPSLFKADKPITSDVTWRWSLDGNVTTGMTYTVKGAEVTEQSVLTVAAYIGNDEVATTEIDVINVNDGADGAKGDKGDDGNGIANTVITYGLSTSETTEPTTWASNMPVLVKGMYLWTRTVQIYTNGTSSTSYQKGYIAKDGAQGLPGTPGKDAQTQYTHIAYADNATGGGFSLTDNTKPYWGMYQDFNAANSNDPTKYKWSKWKGDQGLPGKPGTDGKTPYIHFAYADDNKGTNLSFTDKNQQYMGYYSDYTEANSSDYKKYTWVDRLANVKGGSRNYFKNSLTKTFYTTDAQTFDWRTYIVDAFWKNKDRLKKNFVKISFDITFPVALENDYTANIHFSATPWYSNRVTFKAGTTSRQHFEFGIDLSSASEDYHTDNVFIRFGTNYGFPSGFKIILENMMLSIGSYYPDYIQAIEDTQEQIDSKADSALTQEQLNALAEKNRTLEAELEAKAALETVEAWKKAYDDYITQNNQDKTEAEQKLITLTNRVAEWVKDWEDKKVQWSFLDTNMDFGAEGLRLGKKGSPTSILISNERIGFYSGGTEVASMSNGTLTIDNGIFAKSLQIGHFREEVYEGDSNINVIRWVD
ncbi:hypothetical protein [Streptococcus gallolyticus]|nr:hypothetical protein [Streptococcus gallolyticus]MCY7173680.1 hypothetical protein [Streptococcus gallolyticus subsp. gallolyticus]MCY7175801.1 hypothetical protein [Streptococcus gallolyticus subsp. gallolyticus]MCY7180255.1 hypothetical protein [Streptococcus gallolyticus subsp. gallolyticus]MCY7197807.1 hypothetical protein [Streptococcus gallolyticus subsp. gallolyticus]MCY7204196.1 hypothetical protein [Streptococcus gallolyticus subsp. gallolyticus]